MNTNKTVPCVVSGASLSASSSSGKTTPLHLFEKIRDVRGWSSRALMAAAMGMTYSELKRIELGKIPIPQALLDRLKMINVNPDSFATESENKYYLHDVPIDFKNHPLQKRQPLPIGAIGRDLLRCQLEATVDHYQEYAPDEGSQLTILLAMQQAVRGLPEHFHPGGEPPRNYLELHRAAVTWGQIQIAKFMLDAGEAYVATGGNLRKIQRRKGGWKMFEAAATEQIACLTLSLDSSQELWGPDATLELVHTMVHDSVKFLVSGKLPKPETEEKLKMFHDLLKFLQDFLLWLRLKAPLGETDRRIHPGWVAFHLLESIGIISATASPDREGNSPV